MKCFIYILAFLISNISIAQNSNIQTIDNLMDDFCDCLKTMLDEKGFDDCSKLLNPLDDLKLSESDSLYIMTKMKDKYKPRIDSIRSNSNFESYKSTQIKVKSCNFLQDDDLIEYKMKVLKKDQTLVEWQASDHPASKITGIHDGRFILKDEKEADRRIQELKEEVLNVFNKVDLKTDSVRDVDVYSLNWSEDKVIYYILIKEGNLIGSVIIELTSFDLELLNNLMEKAIRRIRNKC